MNYYYREISPIDGSIAISEIVLEKASNLKIPMTSILHAIEKNIPESLTRNKEDEIPIFGVDYERDPWGNSPGRLEMKIIRVDHTMPHAAPGHSLLVASIIEYYP